jgi:hypothetical protein
MTDERSTVLERYDHAIDSAIIVDPLQRTPADYLLASGFAQAGSPRNKAAVSLHRLHQHVTAEDCNAVRAWCVTAMVPMFLRPPIKLRPRAAHEVFERTLHWHLSGVCPHCEGRMFELVPGVSQVTSTTACHLCHGRGKEPIHHRLPRRYREPGEWLASELERMLSMVESAMKARLRG